MQEFKKWNKITALVVFLVSLIIYVMTMAPTTSFWDCGEFIASSYSMSVPHPPGAPFFLVLGRVFTMFPFVSDIGARVNFISALSSALTVMFLYLTVIHLIKYWKPREKMGFSEFAGAAIGALCFAVSDTFWFNAVEAEVYAISMLFTALVVWLAFVWHDLEERGHHDGDRIILLIFYIIGIAIGVHLLNVLALPVVFLVLYFHWTKGKAFDLKHFFLFWGLATLTILPIYPGVVLWLPKLIYAGGDTGGLLIMLAMLFGFAGLYYYAAKNNLRLLALSSGGVLLILLGYLSYIVILQRSGLNPPLDENDPETLSALIKYLSREQYGSESITSQLFNRKAPFWDYQIVKMYVRYFNWNFIGRDIFSGAWNMSLLGLPFITGLWGMLTHIGRDWKRAFTIGNLFVLTGIAIVIYLNQDDPQPRERDYAYVGSYYAFAIWIGLGAAVLLDDLRKNLSQYKNWLVPLVAVVLLIALPVHSAKTNWNTHDRHYNYVAWDYAYNSLNMLEKDAIIFTNGDNDTFPLWYLQIVEGIRTDVRVVNLSLLNTGWYIKQLRDAEPTIPIPASFTDSFIDRTIDGQSQEAFAWRYWGPEIWRKPDGSSLPRNQWYKVPQRSADGQVNWIEVTPTLFVPAGDGLQDNNFLRVQDRMILEIVREAKWERPIYFAVTVAGSNFCGFRPYLRMDGLAYKVLDRPAGNMLSSDVIYENLDLFEEHFRGLDIESHYFDDNIAKLVQNYRSTYIQLALQKESSGDSAAALALLARMDKFLPEAVVPAYSLSLSLQLGLLFERLGEVEPLRERLVKAENRQGGLSLEDRFMIGSYWIDPLKEKDHGLAIIDPLMKYDPSGQMAIETALLLEQSGYVDEALMRLELLLGQDNKKSDVIAAIIRICEKSGKLVKAVNMLEEWLNEHPNDSSARKRLDRIKLKLENAKP
jgi:hypothetical protein